MGEKLQTVICALIWAQFFVSGIIFMAGHENGYPRLSGAAGWSLWPLLLTGVGLTAWLSQ